jgi:hypothetical protein
MTYSHGAVMVVVCIFNENFAREKESKIPLFKQQSM